ncbi:MAG: sigma-70 family RNA polymerase sigma factor [Acidobacteriaceae bacterium]|nr:sigma-70 family RNA polymerase sigma factor [Acidobacteriaceae bacterium]
MITEANSLAVENPSAETLAKPAEPDSEQLMGATDSLEWAENVEEEPDPHGEMWDAQRDLWLYRERTTSLLWRYTRLAVELGRLPSLLGREFFRARVSRYDAQTFEDSVIFVHDVEACLDSLDAVDKIVIALLALEQYTQQEAARYLHCTQRTIVRHYGEALDRLTEIFLKREILISLPCESVASRKPCQGVETNDFLVSSSAQ